MAKRTVSVNAVCPFYRSEDVQKVYCEGVQRGSSIHLAFGDAKDCKGYMDIYCRDDFKDCPIAAMLWRKYDNEG